MRFVASILSFLFVATAFGQVSDEQFIEQLNVDALKPLSVQHNQTLKTLDSFSRQAMTAITGSKSYKGQPAVYTVLDMSFRPDAYRDVPMIKIKNAVLRQDFLLLKHVDEAEKQRIIKEGTISLAFWNDPRVQELMGDLTSKAVFKNEAVNQVAVAAMTMEQLSLPAMHAYHMIPPVTEGDTLWKCVPDVFGPAAWRQMTASPATTPTVANPAYQPRTAEATAAAVAMAQLETAWRDRNVTQANQAIAQLAANLPAIAPERYPTEARRKVEVFYNGMAQLTKPGIMLYLSALVLFLLSAKSGNASLRLWGLRAMIVAFVVHTAGIAIRWWLVEKSVGNWFESIPIKNMFESVMFSAWFGALVSLGFEIGLIQALVRLVGRIRLSAGAGRALWGAAGSFVGTVSMVALLTVPYFYRDIGGEIGHVAGVLMSYWLYIHVTMVVASYALIGMGFLLSVWWLWGYYKEYGTFLRLNNPHKLSADGAKDFGIVSNSAGGAGVVSFGSILMQALFLARPKQSPAEAKVRKLAVMDEAPQFQATLDACNLVILHLIFWVLGVGIILGAVWADMSWGRPWGWDPKETFALVTWIVYLIIIHVRVIATDKAWWTAVLSALGFFIMLFNWIGVNFFMKGLHSYA